MTGLRVLSAGAAQAVVDKGVAYAGPLPGDLQAKTVYSAGLAARAADPAAAREFTARLTGTTARSVLAQAGYEFDH